MVYKELSQRDKILFVDDEPGIRKLMDMIISSAGYNPVIAKDGQEGYDKFNEYAMCLKLVITDLSMPIMGGIDFVRKVKQDYPDSKVPILGLTGRGTEKIKSDCIDAGMANLLLKPISIKNLENIVHEYAIA